MVEMKRVRVDGGKKCTACGAMMQRYEKAPGYIPAPGRGYYRYWDVCECRRVQNYIHAYVPPISRNSNIQPSKAELNAELDRNLRESRKAKEDLEKIFKTKAEKKAANKKKNKEAQDRRKARKRATAYRHKEEMNRILLDAGCEVPFIPSQAKKTQFYASWEWRTMRMEVLKAHGPVCQFCGSKAGDKSIGGGTVRIVVDHIKPLSKYWNLRLDRNNLQVLCDECNQGKGAWDETDHRPGVDEVPEGNIILGDSWDEFEEQAEKLRYN